eukprot:TRINITY_DN3095_c0_g1_i16.p2 TRINITY_DN3095_c0_g1~~TRINITY_DN3095_c0_g1_i16.p2  ORF type:complete len:102 (-),score=3.28 TRINITY_DN3095_c0_g1_i16:26-331(-)
MEPEDNLPPLQEAIDEDPSPLPSRAPFPLHGQSMSLSIEESQRSATLQEGYASDGGDSASTEMLRTQIRSSTDPSHRILPSFSSPLTPVAPPSPSTEESQS